MADITDDEIKAAWALCAAATPEPWACGDSHGYPWIEGPLDEEIAGPCTVVEWNESGDQAHADARFIAAARALVPRLLEALAARGRRITDLKRALGDAASVLEAHTDKTYRRESALHARAVLKETVR